VGSSGVSEPPGSESDVEGVSGLLDSESDVESCAEDGAEDGAEDSAEDGAEDGAVVVD
jgi:hypothetical protein